MESLGRRTHTLRLSNADNRTTTNQIPSSVCAEMVKPITEEQFKDVTDNYTNVTNDKLGSKIVAFSDQWFADAENLLKDSVPIRDATRFTHAGAWYDGWETRRHNEAEFDYVVIKLGVNGAKIIGCELDTAYFNGNHAPFISVEGNNGETVQGETYFDALWTPIIPKVECGPSQQHFFINDSVSTSFTHIRLRMYPDGGIARFKLYGQVSFDRNHAVITNNLIDTASVLNGGVVVKYNDQHFGKASNLLLPGRGHDMSDGWETKRSREPNHFDYVIIKLGTVTKVEKIVIDTAHFRGNYPKLVEISGINTQQEVGFNSAWKQVAAGNTSADKEHEYSVQPQDLSHVLVVIKPDGGVKRIRVFGTV